MSPEKPSKESSSHWGITAGIIVLVAAVAGISAVGLFLLGDADTDDADVAIAVKDYLQAFSDGDVEEACELETSALQRRGLPAEQDCETNYEAALDQIEDLEYDDVDISDIEVDGDVASANVSYRRVQDDVESECEDLNYSLVEEDGDWRIDDRQPCETEGEG